MSSGKAIAFIFLSSTIMMGAMLLQMWFGPQSKPAADKPAAVEQSDADWDGAGEPEESVPSETDSTQDTETPAVSEQDGENSSSQQDESQADSAPDSNDLQEEVAADQQQADESADPAGVAPPAKDDFVKLGSLKADGSDRYLITVNRNGGTIHRVELNARTKKGRYRYRDLVFEGGYLGSTNFESVSEGLKVTAVGAETPADQAGLKPGDILVSFNDVPQFNVGGIEKWLNENTEPGDSLSIGIQRNGQSKTLTATLTEKPISIIRPEGERVDQDFEYPESFLLSLLAPQDYLDKAWPDLDPGMRTGMWEVTDASDDQMVELKYEIDPQQLEPLGLAGPLVVYKRFRLPQLQPDDLTSIDSRSFHIRMEIEIVNQSDRDLDLAYELDGPTGTTAETWWYANKIHGRTWAIFYIAGARDIVGSTATNSYVFFGCPEIVDDADKQRPEVHYVSSPMSDNPDDRQLRFIGVDSHYFNVSLLPVLAEGEWLEVNAAYAFPVNAQGRLPKIPKNARLKKLVDCTFEMVVPANVPAGGSYVQEFDIFCGPKDPELLDDYGLSDTRTFGWFAWCSIVLLEILHFFYWITFGSSYGIAIILLTVLVRCIMIPFSRKAALNAQMMQHLAPQMKEISERYKDDMEQRAAAQRELYKKYNFNPFGGCFMMFFQLPIFYGLYKGLNVDIALRDKPLIPGMEWCSNLAAPDQLWYWKDWLPGWLADETGYLGPYLNILPLATMVLFIVQQRLFTPPATDDQQKMMQKMMTFMMLFMGIMFFKVPAGLCIYFITSSLWGIIERKLLPKPVLDTDKFAAVEGKNPQSKPPSKREQRKQDLADRARLDEAEERKRRNIERKKKLKKRGL